MLRGYAYILTPYLYTLTLNLDFDFFKLMIIFIPILIPTLIPTTMAPIEKEWAAMANKYGYGIDADEATKDKLVEFTQIIIYIYKTQDLVDMDLWVIFLEQFKGFMVESFKKIYTDLKSKLQRHLFKRSIYVGKHSNRVTISERLFEVI